MTSRPWMPLYVADYRADTAHLSAAQHGAYLLLIMHYWQTGGLPADDAAMARIACMTSAEWKRHRLTIEAFFSPDMKHKRIDAELAKAADISSKRAASAKQKHSNSSAKAPTNAEQLDTHARASSPSQSQKKDSDPDGSARDIRGDLFDKGLKTLANITGKTPDSCRSLVGKWLKSVNDEAIHVLGAIENAERNRVADPVAWISRALKPHGANGHGKRTVHDAASDLLDHVRSFDNPAPDDVRDRAGERPVRLLPSR